MSRPGRLVPGSLLLVMAACGGGTSGPTPPPATYTVTGAVFYDENGNGVVDATEGARIAGAIVDVGGRSSSRTSAILGEFTVDGVPGGAQTVTVRSLPPYYTPPAPPIRITVPLPAGQNVLVPLTLPIGPNNPNLYMAFGDSITIGQGSSDDLGYRGRLEDKLRAWFGRGTLVDEGADATKTNRGAERIDASLFRRRPAYTLIHYGTNDFNAPECKNAPPCFTIDSLRDMILSARGSTSLPVLATIIPADPTALEQPARNEWVKAMDDRIRALAREQNVPLADPYDLFVNSPNFSHLYVDHVHPNDDGYELMAQAFFKAITTTPESTGSWRAVAPPPAPTLFAPPSAPPSAPGAVDRARRHRRS